jgi:ribosomal protein L32E
MKDTENNTRNINPFSVQKTLDRIARKVGEKKRVTLNECKTSDRSI